MSENEKNNPTNQTSSIPLKKETVRVTLKPVDAPPATPSGAPKDESPVKLTPPVPEPTSSNAPPVVPTAKKEEEQKEEEPKQDQAPTAEPKPAPDAAEPTAPTATKPPQPTAPKPPTAPAAGPAKKSPAPTIPLKTAGARPSGAPTVKLSTSNAALGSGAPTIALQTAKKAPLSSTGEDPKPTASLPKATVSLNPPTRPLTPSGSAATADKPEIATFESDQDETGATTFTNILAGVGLAAAIIVLILQLNLASIWIGAEDNDKQGEWSQLLD